MKDNTKAKISQQPEVSEIEHKSSWKLFFFYPTFLGILIIISTLIFSTLDGNRSGLLFAAVSLFSFPPFLLSVYKGIIVKLYVWTIWAAFTSVGLIYI